MQTSYEIRETKDGYESEITIISKKRFKCLECAKRETAEIVMDIIVAGCGSNDK